jgi:signal transduction histidine kinase
MPEITKELNFDPKEERMLHLHSFINILSILSSKIVLFALEIDRYERFKPLEESIIKLSEDLVNSEDLMIVLPRVHLMESIIKNFFQENLSAEEIKSEEFQELSENFLSIFNIVNTRVRELIERLTNENSWKKYSIDLLKVNFDNFFAAVEKNSKGGYKIIQNLAQKGENDYFINFEIDSTDTRTITIPHIFQDVMRDIIANARKYTPLGGKIEAGLHEDKDKLRFIVEDNGIGIPEKEIEKVIDLGFRASNLDGKKTYGGGFGLTKAYQVTKKYGGRMWIDSSLGKGTSVKIEIPTPKN